MARMITIALKKGRKVVFFGNGGSAADAQHISAELVGKFKTARRALRASALTTNSSILTAIGNDIGFDEILPVKSKQRWEPDDVAVGISTSGQSANVIKGVEEAGEIGAKTIALTGSGGGLLGSRCDHRVNCTLRRYSEDTGMSYHDRPHRLRTHRRTLADGSHA